MIRETKKIPSEMYDVRSTALYAALLTLLTWFTPLTWFTLLTWLTLLTCFTLLTWFALLTWLALLTGDGWIGPDGSYPWNCYDCHEYSSYSTWWVLETYTTYTIYTAFIAWRLTLCIYILSYFDCLGHQELENITHNWVWEPYAVTQDRWMGWDGRIIPIPCCDYYSSCGAKNTTV